MKKSLFLLIISVTLINCSSTKKTTENSFSKEEINVIMNANGETPMRVYKINSVTDSLLLRKKSTYVKPDTNNLVLKNFVNRLHATVRDSMSLGLGIAAPQVGILKNIIWVQRLDKENMPFEVYLNPKIIMYSDEKQTNKEGCLSIPNRRETLSNRAKKITIEYDTMEALHKTEVIEAFTAVIFQHEIDHLNGILYLDHLEKEVKDSKKN